MEGEAGGQALPELGLITSVNQVTPGWLTQVLRRQGVLPHGEVVALEAEEPPERGSVIILLTVRYTPEATAAPKQLILKLPHRWRRKNGQREVAFYHTVASQMVDLPVVRCFDACFDPASNQFHVLMESLAETHMAYPASVLPPTEAATGQIIEALARLHAAWWEHPQLGQGVGLRPSEASVDAEQQRAETVYPALMDFLGDRFSPQRRTLCERLLAELWPRVRARLGFGPLTLFHGDPHIGNFLYPRDPVTHQVYIVDWKSWGVEMGVMDMAHLMGVYWFAERRARLEQSCLRTYYDALLAKGVAGYTWEQCWEDYCLGVMRYVFFPMWQWSVGRPDYIWWHHLERVMSACESLIGDATL